MSDSKSLRGVLSHLPTLIRSGVSSVLKINLHTVTPALSVSKKGLLFHPSATLIPISLNPTNFLKVLLNCVNRNLFK